MPAVRRGADGRAEYLFAFDEVVSDDIGEPGDTAKQLTLAGSFVTYSAKNPMRPASNLTGSIASDGTFTFDTTHNLVVGDAVTLVTVPDDPGNDDTYFDAVTVYVATVPSSTTAKMAALYGGVVISSAQSGAFTATGPKKHRGVWPAGVSMGTLSADSVATLTNKKLVPRVLTTNAPGATPSVNIDNYDIVVLTGLATAITNMSTNLTGTPYQGQVIRWRLTDDGTGRTVTWGASFASSTYSALPGTTVPGGTTRLVTEYDSVLGKHVCVGLT